MKIAIIGAGSIVFCKTLILDILATSDLSGVEFALMAPSTKRTKYVEEFTNKVIKENGLNASCYITTDSSDALKGAKYVIATLQVGGIHAYEFDYKIPFKHGVDQCIGDTLGPGGIFRALRSIPVMDQLAADMKEFCEPGALLLNYVNPMSMVCLALSDSGINYVGLCHGVQTTLDLISGYTEVPKSEIDFLCAGINHMGWFLKLIHKGRDLYPVLRENFEKPEYYTNEKVRGEIFRQFGYFMTESTGHLSEYLPYFRKNPETLNMYCDEPGFGGETGAYFKFSKYVGEKYNNSNMLANEPTTLPKRSVEYCSYIIEACETGKTFKFNGNIINNGMISNLPFSCCAEGPMYADATGIHRTVVGNLPIQCAALNMTNINVHLLTVEAAKTGDPELAVQACAIDPLTAASALSLNQIREMAREMFVELSEYMPQFKNKSLKETPYISVPNGIIRAEVPTDPALAINARFVELGK